MQFIDAVTVAGTRRREDGYLVADARIARTGVQEYLGSEVGKPDMATVRVYRPGAEVFADETMKSAAHRPVTNDHPPELVNSENWKSYAVGQTGDEVSGEGIFIRVPLMVSDETAIKDIEAGKQELSAGYTCELDFDPGVTPSGQAYDAIQKNIRLNHVAIVQRGRAGSKVRIGDAVSWGAAPITDHTERKVKPMADLLTVVLGDKAIQVADKDAPILEIFKTTYATDKAKLVSDHAAAIALKDAELAKKDAEIDSLKGKVLSDADLDKRVQARAGLVNAALAIAKDVKTDGLSDADIRKAVVANKLGDAAIAGKPEAYIDARFDILVEDAKKSGADPFRSVVAGGLTNTNDTSVVNKAHTAMVSRLEDAWKTPVKGAA